MNPRLLKSKKWTALPEELLQQTQEIFTETFSKNLAGRTIFTDGRIYTEEVLFRVGLKPKATLRQINFEASIDFNKRKQNLMDIYNILIDTTGSMMEQYLLEDVTEFPLEWTEFEIGKQKVYLKQSFVNTDLENEADALLGEKKGLVQGEDIEEEVDAFQKQIGIDTSEEDSSH